MATQNSQQAMSDEEKEWRKNVDEAGYEVKTTIKVGRTGQVKEKTLEAVNPDGTPIQQDNTIRAEVKAPTITESIKNKYNEQSTLTKAMISPYYAFVAPAIKKSGARDWLNEQSNKMSSDISFNSPMPRGGRNLYDFVGGAVFAGAGEVVRIAENPIGFGGELVVGAYEMVTNPVGTSKTMYSDFTANPTSFTGRMGVDLLVAGKTVKGVKSFVGEIPKPRAFKTFVMRANDFVPKIVKESIGDYDGIALEWNRRAQPLVGRQNGQTSWGRVTFGTPDVKFTPEQLKGGMIFETLASKKIVQKSMTEIYPDVEIQKFNALSDLTRITELRDSKFVQDKYLRDIKNIHPKDVGTVLNWAKENKGQVYGSGSARAQTPKNIWEKYRGKDNPPSDLDINTQYQLETAIIKSQDLLKQLNSRKNMRYKIDESNPTLIESEFSANQWAHAVDIHSKDSLLMQGEVVASKGAYGMRFNQPSIKIEGINSMSLSEQGVRKYTSITTLREEGFSPASHRMKDVPDFFMAQEVLLKSKELKLLEQAKTFYPEEVFKNTETTKFLLEDFSKSPQSPKGGSPTIVMPSIMNFSGGSPSSTRSPTPSNSPLASSYRSPDFSSSAYSSPKFSSPNYSYPSFTSPSPKSPSPYKKSPSPYKSPPSPFSGYNYPSPYSSPYTSKSSSKKKSSKYRRKKGNEVWDDVGGFNDIYKKVQSYTPSVESMLFNIKQKKLTKYQRKTYKLGISVRPLLSK